MTSTCARILALCVFAGSSAGLSGCNTSDVQAKSSSSSAPLSGPPTYNQQYAARNPRVCAKLTTPPTPEQAKILVQCGDESLQVNQGMLTLVTDLQVEMGQPVRYNPQVTHASGVDPSAPSYPLRGQGTNWICSIAGTGPSSADPPAGKNCQRQAAVPKGVGLCEKSAFGDWACTMTTGGGKLDWGLKGPTDY